MFQGNCKCKDVFPKYPKTDYYSPRNHHQTIHKLYNILKEKMSQQMVDRHLILLKQAVQDCSEGFHISDLRYVSRIMELVTERLEYSDKYKDDFQKFLELCALPPLTHDTSEVSTEMVHFQQYISVLGLLAIWLNDEDLRYTVYMAIIHLLIGDRRNALAVEPQDVNTAVEQSHLPEIAVQLVDMCSLREYSLVLDLAFLLSRLTPLVCQKMVKGDGIDVLAMRMGSTQRGSHIAAHPVSDLQMWIRMFAVSDLTCRVLWNMTDGLLQAPPEFLRALRGPCRNALWCLRVAIRADIVEPGRERERNNKVALILRLMQIFSRMSLVESGMANTMTILSVATEVRPPASSWVRHMQFTYDTCYVELKKMLLLVLCYHRHYPAMAELILQNSVIQGLAELLSLQDSPWHPADRLSLAKYALHTLYVLAPHFLAVFVGCGGPLRLLIIVESYITSSVDVKLVRVCLKTLNKFVSLGDPGFKAAIRQHFGVPILNMFCQRVLSNMQLTLFDQWLLACGFSILQVMFEEEPPAGDTPICLVVQYLERVLRPRPEDSPLCVRTVVAALSLLWTLTAERPQNLQRFVLNDGVYRLLDVVEMCPLPVQVVGLGCLVDMCLEPCVVPFLLTWRGGPDKTLVFYSLLARIYIYESRVIRTKTTAEGVISDTSRPLMGERQFSETFDAKKVLVSSPSVADLIASSRPKVYALLQLLNTRHASLAHSINRQYRIANVKLNIKHQIAIISAENYLVLKLYETWSELQQDLKLCKMKAVAVDQEMIDNLITQLQVCVKSVQESQLQVLETDAKHESSEEHKLYNVLREARINDALNALRQLNFLTRTTDYMFMQQHKNKLRKEVAHKLCFAKQHNCFKHRTFCSDLTTTAVFRQKLLLDYKTEFIS